MRLFLTMSWQRGTTPTCLMIDVLLDTHALLWFDVSPERLPEEAAALIRDRRRRVYVSAVTA